MMALILTIVSLSPIKMWRLLQIALFINNRRSCCSWFQVELQMETIFKRWRLQIIFPPAKTIFKGWLLQIIFPPAKIIFKGWLLQMQYIASTDGHFGQLDECDAPALIDYHLCEVQKYKGSNI